METVMKPMTKEAIAITEKKLSMTLDEIIKMSKKASLKKAASRPEGALIQKRSKFREKRCELTSEAFRKAVIASSSQKKQFTRKTHYGSGVRYPLQNVEMIRAPAEETLRKNGWNTPMEKKTLDARFADLKFRRPMQVLRQQQFIPAVNLRQFRDKLLPARAYVK